MKCYAIEYFIKENEKDEKISEVKLYRANKNGGTFKFASKPIYCDRDKFVEMINSREVFTLTRMVNSGLFSVSSTFNITINNLGYINSKQNSREDFLPYVEFKIK
ncbi:TPA: hypothetical protein ACTN2G_002647 [Staphylococcus aureus]|uniref:Uncharacterized protein n=2 Tax=Staphylococcus aureus TaxID=1280 RepID=D2J9I4_STAAU|nr:hypothetical protein [Staphylococcus aureus]ACZ68482.1 hypothetical protein SAP057A_009 [Staphylococcus aureus]ARF19307.1 putative extracellular protein [Staphylococcus aureus]ARF19360.1 putative extracellular protein [Staphylococcus aureus]ARF19440.1 putative extracellular protein [Staphylococcus aureus]ARF19487.1 putative extracellular protein [Staphylococcus aureus]